MKKLFILAIACIATFEASAQTTYYQDKDNVDMLRHAQSKEVLREEFVLPDVNGYKVLKSDLHSHTIYSDGNVTPEYRVREAWVDGLDVLAITEHIEYRPWEGKMISYLKGYFPGEPNKAAANTILADLNVSNNAAIAAASGYGITIIPGAEITRDQHKIGHYNALFVKDVNTIYDPDPAVSMKKAREQGALIMHNHPGWIRKNVDIIEFEKKVYDEGLIDGIEIMNGAEFYPPIVTRAQEKKFFMAANTDIHGTTTMDYVAQGHRRNMTFILAKENTLPAIKEALKARRTLAYSFGTLAGEEQLVKDFFMACVKFETFKVDGNGKRSMRMVNNSSMNFILRFGGNPVELRPFTSRNVSVAKDKELIFTVENIWIPGDAKHPTIKLKW
ncbi:MAG: histidinol-phosphatase [Rikenellaceae bacterium]|nr:histidinol-phosphatase [Rikenellaceae bacterium]